MGNQKEQKESKEKNEIKDYFSEERISKETPFMQRILVRKNLVYKLLASKSSMEKEEPEIKPKNIKDLIKNTL